LFIVKRPYLTHRPTDPQTHKPTVAMAASPTLEGVSSNTFLLGARPSSRNKTTYNSMNDWMRMQGEVATSRAPVMYAGAAGFKEMPSVETCDKQTSSQAAEDYNDKFEKSYSDLQHQIAYRYPNPGLPRIRQGAIGGTWRHIKEVLGHHGGSRICFIDGLVSVYDTDKFTQALQPQLPYRGKMVQPPYAPTQQEYADSKKGVHFPPVETDVDRKLRMNSQPIHRGHYKFN